MNRFSRLRKGNNEHLARVQYDAYQDGALSAAATAAYRQHLAACPECKKWVSAQGTLAQQLRNESSPPAFLTPAAAARIQQNMSSRMRRAMIMNNMKAIVAGTAVIAVLALIVGIFAVNNPPREDDEIAEEVTAEATAALVPTELAIVPGTLDEQLVAAVQARNLAEVERLLEAGADPNTLDADGNALLPRAVRLVDPDTLEALANAGADLDGTLFADPGYGLGYTELSALGWAVATNQPELAELLIALGADVNFADRTWQFTPLHVAAFIGFPDMATLLLDNGADPNAQSTHAVEAGTPLHFALASRTAGSTRALLDGGAEVDILSPSGQTPLMLLMTMAFAPSRTVKLTLLLEHGADPNLQNKVGNSALHLAAKWNRPDAVRILVEHGASLDLQNNAGKAPLDVAVDDQIIELLQELGAQSAAATEPTVAPAVLNE